MQNLPPSTLFPGPDAAGEPAASSRTGTALTGDPFLPSPHVAAMCEAQAVLAPLVMVWDYKVPDVASFTGWLASKDILLKQARLERDPKLSGVRYGGTYRVVRPDDPDSSRFRTHWGFATEEAMQAMHTFCSGDYERATIAQIDLIEFVRGLKSFVAGAGDENFEQNVLVASAAEAT